MPKIYTRAGDLGQTLLKDQRLPKGALVFDLLGDLDELGTRLGTLSPFPLRDEIQRALAALAADIAGYTPFTAESIRVLVPGLEAQIDAWMNPQQAPADAFSLILPRGSVHIARTVCRRAERSLARLDATPAGLSFLNRLSDFLYALAERGPVRSRTVLVTGGARRIGRAICEELASRGWRVIVHARCADDADAPRLAERLGGLFVAADLADALGPARLFQEVCRLAPDLSAIVNNAAVFSTQGTLPPDEAAALQQVNVEAPTKLTTLLGLRLMEHAPFAGAVVDVLDNRILAPAAPDETPYAASKRALRLAMEKSAGLLAASLRVNGVAPGPVLVPTNPTQREAAGDLLLAQRPTPRDVAETVAFLLETPAITGETIAVDAGQSLLNRLT